MFLSHYARPVSEVLTEALDHHDHHTNLLELLCKYDLVSKINLHAYLEDSLVVYVHSFNYPLGS